jgi:hypothetical protein
VNYVRTTLAEILLSVSLQITSVASWANVVPSSPIVVNLVMEALEFSETSALIRATQRNIQEDGILHRRRRGDLKSYMLITSFRGKIVVLDSSAAQMVVFG